MPLIDSVTREDMDMEEYVRICQQEIAKLKSKEKMIEKNDKISKSCWTTKKVYHMCGEKTSKRIKR